MGRVRLALLTLGRALNYVDQMLGHRLSIEGLGLVLKGQLRDIEALEVHADFLSSRLGLMSDATMGRINLAQNTTVRIVSVVAVLFSPPTLIASIYGMNFVHMPELAWSLGYPMALVMMVGSAVADLCVFPLEGLALAVGFVVDGFSPRIKSGVAWCVGLGSALAVGELGRALFDEGGHAFFLIFGGEHRVE